MDELRLNFGRCVFEHAKLFCRPKKYRNPSGSFEVRDGLVNNILPVKTQLESLLIALLVERNTNTRYLVCRNFDISRPPCPKKTDPSKLISLKIGVNLARYKFSAFFVTPTLPAPCGVV